MTYGAAPEVVGTYDLDWEEYMHFMYLPVVMPWTKEPRLPDQLEFLALPLYEAHAREEFAYDYVYVTARRGYATPGNPLNRPGWHADGFGTNDVNYIWADRWPTRFAIGDFGEISDDHIVSGVQFTYRVQQGRGGDGSDVEQSNIDIKTYPDKTLLRLDPFVVHAAPEIPAPGGERSFLKISFSNERYNLKGNSHNYLFDYDWKMWDRDVLRNDPAYAGKDVGPQS